MNKMGLFVALTVIFVLLVVYYIIEAQKKFDYWRKRGVQGPRPWPLLGTFPTIVKMGHGFFDIWGIKKFGRIFGYFDGKQPVLVISDPDILRDILVKDFSQFANHRVMEIAGSLLEKSVNLQKDQKWKDVRHALIPAFTSGRLKEMNELISDSCKHLDRSLEEKADSGEAFECLKLFRTVTMDILVSVFFGVKIDSQNDPNDPFTKNASDAFNFSVFNPALIISFLFPWAIPVLKWLEMQFISKKALDFFVENTRNIIKMRNESGTIRRDFLQLMMHSVAGTTGQVTKKPEIPLETQLADIINPALSVGTATDNCEMVETTATNFKLTVDEVVAQAVIFFLGGFETTSMALSVLAFSLAVDQPIQDRLRESIEKVMEGRDEPDYEAIAEMQYLDACVNEALRLYPPVSRLDRDCNTDWERDGLKVEKGTMIGVPVFAIHRNPEFWPNPEVYDPERFSYENKQKILPYTFNTFGQGPRNCIGMRFAYYEIKMVMVHILRKFRIVLAEKQEIPLELKDTAGFMTPKNGVRVHLERL